MLGVSVGSQYSNRHNPYTSVVVVQLGRRLITGSGTLSLQRSYR